MYDRRRAFIDAGNMVVCAMMKKSGFSFTGHPLWTKAEDAQILLRYPNIKAIRSSLKRRTKPAIHARITKLMRRGVLRAPRIRHMWTDEEKARLRRLFKPDVLRAELLREFPTISFMAIKQMARYIGARRPKRPYNKTRHPICDEIRERVYYLNYSLNDLGKMLKLGGYYRNFHRRKQLNIYRVRQAIEVLGGKMTPKGAVWI